MQQTFRDSLGNIYLELKYVPEHKYVHADFQGMQTPDSVMASMNAILDMLVKYNCQKYLSDNSNLKGGWDFASDWIRDEWLPLAIEKGMLHLAHILAPELMSMRADLEINLDVPAGINVMVFDKLSEGKAWLIAQ